MSLDTEIRCSITPCNQFWLHYLSLEKSLVELCDYVSFSATNYASYSFKTMQLIFAACSEVDSILKHIRMHLYNITLKDVEKLTINHHSQMLLSDFPLITDTVVTSNLSGITLDLKPFELLFYEYEIHNVSIASRKLFGPELQHKYKDATGSWWKQYNNLKHQRLEYFEQANLYNALNALSALHVLNLIYAVVKDNLAEHYASILIQADCIQQFPVLKVKNGGLIKYPTSICYGCHLNNKTIYPKST